MSTSPVIPSPSHIAQTSAWTGWSERINETLVDIDKWFGAHDPFIAVPTAAEELKRYIRRLSVQIAECPGLPGNESFAPADRADRLPGVGTDPIRQIYPPIPVEAFGDLGPYMRGDAAVERFEEQLASRQRLDAALKRMNDTLASRASQRRASWTPALIFCVVVWALIVIGVGAYLHG